MRNIWTICRRELYSYFVSPIAWVLLAIFALLSGVFTYIISASFVRAGLESQMSGQAMPMNLNEQVIAPLFSNIAVVGLFLIPLISMRLFAEEKRQGTIELLVTSPVHDLEIVIGKWLSAVIMYAALLVVLLLDYSFLFMYGNPDWKPVATGFLGILLQGACLLAFGTFISTLTRNQIVAGAVGFRARAGLVDSELDDIVRQLRHGAGSELSVDRQPHGQFLARRDRHQRLDLLPLYDFLGLFLDGPFA